MMPVRGVPTASTGQWRRPMRTSHLRLCGVAVFCAVSVWSQAVPGRLWINGVLIDPSDRPVGGAAVTLSSAVGEQVLQTDLVGEFRFNNLAPGDYRLRVTVPGFESLDRRVRLGGRPPGRIVMRLALAPLRQQLTVAAEAARVSSDIGGNVDVISVERSMLDQLPVLGLDYITVLSRFLDASSPGGGGPSLIVDGMEARNVGMTASAIQEIRINNNAYTAEYPRSSRRRIEVITKSSADRYHGTFNFLFRDHRLNARDALALARPQERRRIYEGSLFRSCWPRQEGLIPAVRRPRGR